MVSTQKIATISLLLIALAPLFYALSFQWQQQAIRHHMKEEMEVKMLHTLTLHQNELHWTQPGKEIIVNGKLFDVKFVKPGNNGYVVLQGLFDEEETSLADLIKKNQQNNGNKYLVQFFQLQLNLPSTELDLPTLINENKAKLFVEYSSRLCNLSKRIITPPPQV